jgi:probable DNA metabolism protein
MTVFYYDKTFDGLLTAVFDAYFRKSFPDKLLGEGDIEPMFATETHSVLTQTDKANRVWTALQKKISKLACNMMTHVWLSDLPESDELLFRYICKNFDSKQSIEMNFADADVLELNQIAGKVSMEKLRVIQFVRFQKTADGIFFAPIAPMYNVFPLTIHHFKDRFADQRWIVYDIKRNYGYHYDLREAVEITLNSMENFVDGKLNENLLAENEKLFQDLWKSYFKSMTIKERINPKLHRQNMPQRFWKYLTEKQ